MAGAAEAGEEVGQQVVAGRGEHALGMELHALDGVLAVADAHDRAVGRRRRDLEAVGHAVGRDGEGVVAGRGERRRQAGEDAAPVVLDRRRLAVHQLGRADDGRPVGVGDGLVAEAHAEDGDAAVGELGHRGAGDAGVLRPTRAGRQQHAVGFEGERAGDVELVVAVHDRLRPELAEVLDEVVDEAVVAVDDEHPRRRWHGTAPYLCHRIRRRTRMR